MVLDQFVEIHQCIVPEEWDRFVQIVYRQLVEVGIYAHVVEYYITLVHALTFDVYGSILPLESSFFNIEDNNQLQEEKEQHNFQLPIIAVE